MASDHCTLFSETTRCARQQRWALLLFLLLGLLNYCLYTQGSWTAPVPTAGSRALFFSRVVLGYLLSSLFITVPWLLLTQATLQHSAITSLHLIQRSVRLFPKLVAVQVITCLFMTILVLITTIFTAIIWALLLGITGTIEAPSGMISLEYFLQLLNSRLWICGTLLPPLLLIWYLSCRLSFSTYLVIAEPQTALLATVRLSWRWSRSCLCHLLVATLLVALLTYVPSYGLQLSSLRSNSWVNIGWILYSCALGLVASIYFFVLYQQRKPLPEHTLNLSKH
ncbi:hypothetical protein [unidentified bacterial endosymbiont]|uniref:hypothetical protein n=1 Tax=unidentified bacterial endosymbiont TaxID=2355 RepID=UPI00209DDDED|nr:hypothetical protein [unidentified bacterial endosymbiont]